MEFQGKSEIMDKKTIEESARAAAAAGYHVGHVFARFEEGDLHLSCTACGAEETVSKYGEGKQPQRFVWLPVKMDGREYVKCERCRRVHDSAIPFAR